MKQKYQSILFTGQMIRAVLEGRKTVTRRVITDINPTLLAATTKPEHISNAIRCRYGKAGNRLWVRETWRPVERKEDMVGGILFAADKSFVPIENTPAAAELWSAAYDNGKHKDNWRPSIYMPRWVSRITLEVVSVRAERLQQITEADAKAEGVQIRDVLYPDEPQSAYSYVAQFKLLWNSINAARGYSWGENPFVWRIEFRKVDL